jgi:hypothetical protein
MPAPVILLPARFDGTTLSEVAAEVVKKVGSGEWPQEIEFDFSKLDFIQPAGVVFLSNLGHWLSEHGSRITLTNCDVKRSVIK